MSLALASITPAAGSSESARTAAVHESTSARPTDGGFESAAVETAPTDALHSASSHRPEEGPAEPQSFPAGLPGERKPNQPLAASNGKHQAASPDKEDMWVQERFVLEQGFGTSRGVLGTGTPSKRRRVDRTEAEQGRYGASAVDCRFGTPQGHGEGQHPEGGVEKPPDGCHPSEVQQLKHVQKVGCLPKYCMHKGEEGCGEEAGGLWAAGLWERGLWEGGLWGIAVREEGLWEGPCWEGVCGMGACGEACGEETCGKEACRNGVWEGGFWVGAPVGRGLLGRCLWAGGLWGEGWWGGDLWVGGLWERGWWVGGMWEGGSWVRGLVGKGASG